MKLLLIFPVLLLSQWTLASPCSEKVQELATIHLELDQDPSLLLEIFPAEVIGGQAGMAIGAGAGALPRTPKLNLKVKKGIYAGLNQAHSEMERIKQQFADSLQRGGVTGASSKGRVVLGEFYDTARSVASGSHNSPLGSAFQNRMTLPQAQKIVDGILYHMGADLGKFNPMEKRILTGLVRDFYPNMETYNVERKKIADRLKVVSQHVRNLKAFRTRQVRIRNMGMVIGGFLGIAAGHVGKREVLRRECGEYGVQNLIGYFSTSLADMTMVNGNACFFNAQGVEMVLNNPGEAEKLCKEFPKIVEALENSLYLLSKRLTERINDKTSPPRDVQLNCGGSPHLQFDLEGIKIEIDYEGGKAGFKFQQDGSQSMLVTSEVHYPYGEFPEFVNTSNTRFRNQMADEISYRSLTQYYLNTPGAPTSPIHRRKYLTGAAILYATSTRNLFRDRCQTENPAIEVDPDANR